MATSELSPFGALLRRQRLAAGLTQGQLAERAGLSARGVSDLERGRRRCPHPETIRRLAEALELPAVERAALAAAARPHHILSHQERTTPHLGALPVSPTPLFGREADVAAVRALVQETGVRLLTLTGPAGVGKTRLAAEAAAELRVAFPDGACFVPLAPVADPALVAPTIAQALGIPERDGRSPLARLADHLHNRRTLLVLDNFEQLLPAAPLVAELLAACPRLTVLATSRAALRLVGEREVLVRPLALPDPCAAAFPEALARSPAVALFVARARAVRADFRLTDDNAAAVAEICARLDGLPLAIELAAARCRVLSPPAILARLGRRLALLTGGERDRPSRHQTLRAAIGWSDDLLSDDQQRLFRRLAAFVGGCTLEAAAAVTDSERVEQDEEEANLLDRLSALVEANLVTVADEADGEPRFGMLETIREYAVERLGESGEEAVIRRAHAVYYLALAEAAEPTLAGPEAGAWLDRLEREHDNLRAALSWSLRSREAGAAAIGLRLAAAAGRFWHVRGHLSEGRAWLAAVLARPEAACQVAVRAKARFWAGNLAYRQSDYTAARERLEESLADYRQVGDNRGVASALRMLGVVAYVRNDVATWRACQEAGVALARETGDRPALAQALVELAYAVLHGGRTVEARRIFEESLALHRDLGDAHGAGRALLGLSNVVTSEQRSAAPARPLLEEALAIFRAVGDTYYTAVALDFLGLAASDARDAAAARALQEEGLLLLRQLGDKQAIANALDNAAYAAIKRGDYGRAAGLLAESLTLWREVGMKERVADWLELSGVVAGAHGRDERVARLFGAAATVRETIGARRAFPMLHDLVARTQATARARLPRGAWDAAWAAGRAMSPEQALADALPAAPGTTEQATEAAPQPQYPAGLTAREVEVLRLIAAGRTNREIAALLGVSPNTVLHHVTHILTKTDADNRAAAAAFALRHGLA